jgi:hypothetical protein
VALRGYGGDQVLEKLARLRYACALAGLSARTGRRRMQRTGDREVDLGLDSPWHAGGTTVTVR